MKSYRNTATITGILFIAGTVAGILSLAFTGSVLKNPDFLVEISENQNQITTGSLLVLIMGFSLAMMSVVLYPILKKYNEVLALGAVVFRGALEAVLYIAMALIWLLLLAVGREYVNAGTAATALFQTLGSLLLKAAGQTGSVLDIVFSLGALMIYFLFHQSNLIPRWLSVWGLTGAGLYLISGLFGAFNMDYGILEAPLAVQEMVMAMWLIIKGFDQSALNFNSR